MEGFNHIEIKKPLRERISVPHIDAIIGAYEKHFGKEKNKEEIEALKEIIYSYIEQRVENTYLYKSEKIGASFVYSVTNTADLAKQLYSKFNKGKNLEFKKDKLESNKSEKDFMFVGGLVNTKGGNEYVSQEEVIHRMIEEIPRALESLKDGKEPKNKEIYTFGSPTNELGNVSEKFVENLKDNNAAEQLGLLYAESISSMLSKDSESLKATNIYFNGISMGAGFAIETAKKLIADGVVTQSHEVANKPFLQVQINIPPGQSAISEKIKKWQIPIGFAIQVANSLITDSYMRKVMMGDKAFIDSKNSILTEKGIKADMSPEQSDLKKKALSLILKNLTSGIPIPENIKVTELIGTSDPLMYSHKFSKKVKEQKSKFKNEEDKPLGENIVKNKGNENRRTFGINTSHNIPFLRDSEFNRLKKAAESLVDLMKGK